MGILVVFLMTLFWFVLRQDYGVVLFLSHLVMVTEPAWSVAGVLYNCLSNRKTPKPSRESQIRSQIPKAAFLFLSTDVP